MDGMAYLSPGESTPVDASQSSSQDFEAATSSAFASEFLKETGKLLGIRNQSEDAENDRLSTNHYLGHPELEADITPLTRLALQKDTDSLPPQTNPDGSTTYTVVQIGLSSRPSDLAKLSPEKTASTSETEHKEIASESGRLRTAGGSPAHVPIPNPFTPIESPYYKREVKVTVPKDSKNLSQCSFVFNDRKMISETEFTKILTHDRSRLAEFAPTNKEVEFYTHGVYTGDKLADSQALLLGLTNGRPTVTIDWPAYPNQFPDYLGGVTFSSFLHYMEDRASAATSGPQLAPAIDKVINKVGAENTVMIGFSHGGMFNAKYLRHRVDSGLPKIHSLILAHPDLPITTPELYFPQTRRGLLSSSAERPIVIGGENDRQLFVARFNPFARGLRLGNNSPDTRNGLKQDSVLPITELDRKDPNSDQHILNYAGIAALLNGGKQRTDSKMQEDFINATEKSRKR